MSQKDIENGGSYYCQTYCDHCNFKGLVLIVNGWGECPRCGYPIGE